MPARDVVLWGSMIAGYAQHGHGVLALELFNKMQEDDIKPSVAIFLCILKACGSIEAIGNGRLIHKQVISSALESCAPIGNSLIDMYSKSGSLYEAQKVFDRLSSKDVVSWGALIEGYAQHGQGVGALELFVQMQENSIKPSKVIFASILKACGLTGAIEHGQLIHDMILKYRLESDLVVGITLVDMYARCKGIMEARKVFDSLASSNVLSWGAMIAGYALHGYGILALELFDELQMKGIQASKSILICVLKACSSIGALGKGRLVHYEIIRSGLKSDMITGSTLVDMYAKCGSLDEAYQVFEELTDRDVVSWSAIIAGYVEHGNGLAALRLFEKMLEEAVKPDKVTYLCVLKACGSIRATGQGRLIVRSGYKLDVVVGSSLVDMYAKCGCLDEAYIFFVKMPTRDAVAWSALIAGYVQHGQAVVAIELFERMEHEDIIPSKAILLCMVQASGYIGCIQQGRLVHVLIIAMGFESDAVVGSSLVDMYAKCGCLEEACSVFNESRNCDVVSYGTMIAGYVLHEQGLNAIELFEKMQQEGVKPDKVTLMCILKACVSVGALGQGMLIHNFIILAGFELDLNVATVLIDLYAKCGYLEEAYKVFRKLQSPNVVSWGAIIPGHSPYSNGRLAKQHLEDMQQQGLKPDGVMFLNILAACSHAGLFKEGCQYFRLMREDYGITPDVKHYNCMVDLLGRGGFLNEAEDLLQSMPMAPDIIGWLSLLSGCKTHSNMEVGKWCFDEAARLDQSDASGYVLMSNIYADFHLCEDADKTEELRKHKSAWKKPGKAWLEVSDKLHEFIVTGQSYSEGNEVCSTFARLSRAIKRGGYVPELALVLELMSDLNKQDAHSEM